MIATSHNMVHGALRTIIIHIMHSQKYTQDSGYVVFSLQWRHNGHNGASNHQPHDCLLNRLFRRRSKKTSKLRVTGFCAGNSPVTGEFPAQKASNAENVSNWWRHHGLTLSSRIASLAPLQPHICSNASVNQPWRLSNGSHDTTWNREYIKT